MVLRTHGVEVTRLREDWYEMVDLDGDPLVQYLPNPVPSEIVARLYRAFGELHGFSIIALRKNKKH